MISCPPLETTFLHRSTKTTLNHHRSPLKVNRQIGVKVSKFLVVSGPIPTGHVTQRIRNGRFRLYNGACHYNGGNTKVSEHRHLLFVKLLELGKLE